VSVQQPEFIVEIGIDGKVRVEVKGVNGQRCMELADLVREIVGREESRDLTAEYYRGAVRVAQRQQLHRGRKG